MLKLGVRTCDLTCLWFQCSVTLEPNLSSNGSIGKGFPKNVYSRKLSRYSYEMVKLLLFY